MIRQVTLNHFDNIYRTELINGFVQEFELSSSAAIELYLNILYFLHKENKRYKLWSSRQLLQEIRKLAVAELRKTKRLMDNNFGLSETQFLDMVKEMQAGNNQQFEKVFINHFKQCRQYLIFKYKASPEDAYDMTMDTLVDFHQRLIRGKVHYGNLRFLFTQMAGQRYLKWLKKPTPDILPDDFDVYDIIEGPSPEVLDAFQQAWVSLHDRCRQVLHLHYYNNIPFNEIAEQLERSAVAIRKQKQRCVEKLRELFANFH